MPSITEPRSWVLQATVYQVAFHEAQYGDVA